MKRIGLVSAITLCFGLLTPGFGQGSAFTYQGRLTEHGDPAQGLYDLRFDLLDSSTNGTSAGVATNLATAVSNGLFTVTLDFGHGVFDGTERWLEIGVRTNGPGDFTVLSPRTELTPTPYAVYSAVAGQAGAAAVAVSAQSAAVVTGPVDAGQLTGTISPDRIGAGSITMDMLAEGAVGSSQLAAGAVTADKILQDAFGGVGVRTSTGHPGTGIGSRYGHSLARVGSGHYVVGAVQDGSGANAGGSVFVYNQEGVLLATVTNPTPATSEQFGDAVAAVGSNRFVVGAPRDSTHGMGAGIAYLYDLGGALVATVTNPTTGNPEEDDFGRSVAGVGTNKFLVGAPSAELNLGPVGLAYLFDYDGTFVGAITNPTAVIDEEFGSSLAAMGSDRFVVGDPGDGTDGHRSGRAYLYDLERQLLTTITNPAPWEDDEFGRSAASIGTNGFSITANDSGGSRAGTVHLFDADGVLIRTIGSPEPVADDRLGDAVAVLDSGLLLIGADGVDHGANGAGSAYLFDADGSRIATMRNPDPGTGDQFGHAVAALGPDRMLAGTPFDDTDGADAGRVYLFDVVRYAAGLVAANVANDAITADQIADGVVGPAELANKYQSGSVDLASLASDAGPFQGSETNFTVSFPLPFAVEPIVSLNLQSPDTEVHQETDLYLVDVSSNEFAAHVHVPQVAHVVDPGGLDHVSLVNINGRPAVAYRSSGGLVYARANDAHGGSWGAPVTVEADAYAGGYASLAEVNGRPAVAYRYYDGASQQLKYVRAQDGTGASWDSPLVIDAAEVGGYVSLNVVNGRPAVSYYDTNNDDLYFIRAHNADGSTWGAPVVVATQWRSGRSTSLAVVSGNPAISYVTEYWTNFVSRYAVRYVRGNDANGASWGTPVEVHSLVLPMRKHTSLKVVNGHPAISHEVDDTTRYIRATDVTGSAWGSSTTLVVNAGEPSMAVVNGHPAIGYLDRSGNDLAYVQADNLSGTSWGTPVTVDTEGDLGAHASLAEIDGQPAIAYGKVSGTLIKYIRSGPPAGASINWIAVEP